MVERRYLSAVGMAAFQGLYDLSNDPLERKNLLGNKDPVAASALTKFQSVIDAMPNKDARPRYRKRQALPWDKRFTSD